MKSKTIKARTIEHWTNVPIGSQTTGFRSDADPFSTEYFEDHARFRYEVYSPWLRDVARFDQYRGKKLLEVGCGMGTDLLQYARGGAVVTGLDLTLHHLELACKRFGLFRQSGTFVNGDAERLPFPDQSFDFVFSNGVLHHTPDTQRAVEEIHRVLKPGGETLILLYHKNSLTYYLQILLRSGTRRFAGRLLRGRNPFTLSPASVLSASTDGETNPLTKVYSRAEGLRLMRSFPRVTAEIFHLHKGDFPLSRLFPENVLQRLSKSVGWYLVLRGFKGTAS